MSRGAIAKGLGILALLLIAAEIGLRVILGLGHPLLMQVNPLYGYMSAPNQDLHRFFKHIHINSYGMRSDDIDARKPTGERRILLVGDSVLFGTTLLDQDSIFTSRLQRDLATATPRTKVMNASVGGWAPSNELGFLRAKGALDADLIVFVLNTRDLSQPFAAFHESLSYPTHNPPTAIGELLLRYILPKFFRQLEVYDPGSVPIGEPDIETSTPKVLATLSAARKFASEHGAHFAIILSPFVGPDATKYRQQWDKGISMLLDWAKRENVPVIDMRPEFAGHPASEIYADEIHLKPFGHELIEKAFLRSYSQGQL